MIVAFSPLAIHKMFNSIRLAGDDFTRRRGRFSSVLSALGHAFSAFPRRVAAQAGKTTGRNAKK